MTPDDLRQLASLLASRVKDKSDAGDSVAMFTTARLLDQVNEEVRALDADEKPTPPSRRIFVRG